MIFRKAKRYEGGGRGNDATQNYWNAIEGYLDRKGRVVADGIRTQRLGDTHLMTPQTRGGGPGRGLTGKGVSRWGGNGNSKVWVFNLEGLTLRLQKKKGQVYRDLETKRHRLVGAAIQRHRQPAWT